jgi:hypothetical protein
VVPAENESGDGTVSYQSGEFPSPPVTPTVSKHLGVALVSDAHPLFLWSPFGLMCFVVDSTGGSECSPLSQSFH